MSGEYFRGIKSAKHVLNADNSREVYHNRQTSSFAQTIPFQHSFAAGKCHRSGESFGSLSEHLWGLLKRQNGFNSPLFNGHRVWSGRSLKLTTHLIHSQG